MMTIVEAKAELEELRGFAEQGQSLAHYKERVASLYWQVCRKRLRQCKCRDVLSDALTEIYSQLKHNEMKDSKTQARLVAGVVLFVGGNHYTNVNLTDEVARMFLAKFPMRKNWFEVLPPDEVAEMPENGTEIVTAEAEGKSELSAPKKKKSAKRRK